MSTHIHPTAIVDATATLGNNVSVGPFCIISADTIIGNDVEIMGYSQILPNVTLGSGSKIYQGVVLGGDPQDVTFDGHPTPTTIGERVVIREFATVHRGTKETGTVVGNDCMLMVYTHLGHDVHLGHKILLANGVQVGGFVEIGDFAAIGGMTPIHQFSRIGAYSFVGGGCRVVQDVPPFILASGEPLRYGGLNVVGLKRQNIDRIVRKSIKDAYHLIYRSEHSLEKALDLIRETIEPSPNIEMIVSFIEGSSRGLI